MHVELQNALSGGCVAHIHNQASCEQKGSADREPAHSPSAQSTKWRAKQILTQVKAVQGCSPTLAFDMHTSNKLVSTFGLTMLSILTPLLKRGYIHKYR